MCCDGWDLEEDPNGVCPECGGDTFDGEAITGCNWSPRTCDTCGAADCDLSC